MGYRYGTPEFCTLNVKLFMERIIHTGSWSYIYWKPNEEYGAKFYGSVVKCQAYVRNTPDRTTKFSWWFALKTFSLERIKNISVLENVF